MHSEADAGHAKAVDEAEEVVVIAIRTMAVDEAEEVVH